MARGKKRNSSIEAEPEADTRISLDEIDRLTGRYEEQKETVEAEKVTLKECVGDLKELGLRVDAWKTAHKLRTMEPGKVADWLRTFDACVEAFRLRDQGELPLGSVVEAGATLQ